MMVIILNNSLIFPLHHATYSLELIVYFPKFIYFNDYTYMVTMQINAVACNLNKI